jgi:hypothetical protein
MSAGAVFDPVHAEYLALARTLRVAPDEIGYLNRLPAADLHEFRLQIVRALSSANKAGLERIASSASFVPAAVSARVTGRTESTLFVARMASMVDQARVAEVGRRLPPALLANIAVEMDPADLVDMVGSMSLQQLQRVVEELCARGDWVTLGGIAGESCSADLLAALHSGLGPSDMLRVANLVYDNHRLSVLVGSLDENFIGALVRSAAIDGLWLALAHVCNGLNSEQQAIAIRYGRQLDENLRRQATAATGDAGIVSHFGTDQ